MIYFSDNICGGFFRLCYQKQLQLLWPQLIHPGKVLFPPNDLRIESNEVSLIYTGKSKSIMVRQLFPITFITC